MGVGGKNSYEGVWTSLLFPNLSVQSIYMLLPLWEPDSIFIDSFSTYLSPLEEELIPDVIIKNELPDDELR